MSAAIFYQWFSKQLLADIIVPVTSISSTWSDWPRTISLLWELIGPYCQVKEELEKNTLKNFIKQIP